MTKINNSANVKFLPTTGKKLIVPVIEATLYCPRVYHPKKGATYLTDHSNHRPLHDEHWEPPLLIFPQETVEIGDKFLLDGKIHTFDKLERSSGYMGCYSNGMWIYQESIKNRIGVFSEQFSSKQLEAIVHGKLRHGDTIFVQCDETNDEETLATASGFSLTVPVNIQYRVKNNPILHLRKERFSFEDLLLYQKETGLNAVDFESAGAQERIKNWFNKTY